MQDVGTPDLLRLQGNIVAWESVARARRARAALRTYASPVAHWRDLTAEEAQALGGLLRLRPADAVCCEGTASVADPARFWTPCARPSWPAAVPSTGGRVRWRPRAGPGPTGS